MKIYRKPEEAKQELKKPLFRFVDKEMTAVDERGIHICTIVNFASCKFTGKAKECLDRDGYFTDWAEWDNEGRMIKLLEDFE